MSKFDDELREFEPEVRFEDLPPANAAAPRPAGSAADDPALAAPAAALVLPTADADGAHAPAPGAGSVAASSAAAAAPVVGLVEKESSSRPSQPPIESPPPPEEQRLPANGPSAPPDLGDAFQTKKAEEYYYDESAKTYWLRDDKGRWVFVDREIFKAELKKTLGLRDKANVKAGEALSPLEEKVRDVTKNSRVAYAGLLAGYRAGIHKVAGRLVLVSEDPVIIKPVAGEWPTLRKFFDGLLVGQEPADENGKTVTIDQRAPFFGWLQHVVKCLQEGRTDSGLALFMAGEPDCGKSFLAWVLRQILGGRVARPYNRMIGRDNFNKAEAESVLLLVDDDNQSDTRLEARLKFGGETKMIVANNELQLRAMQKDGFAIEALRRLVVLVNLQLSRLMVIPPFDGDFNDKADLLKGYRPPLPPGDLSTWRAGADGKRRPTIETPYEQACWPAPMPTRTPEEKEAYRDRVRSELPAFVHWLLYEFKLPAALTGGRFVVRHWHHPALLAQLHELSPHVRIWELLIRSQVVFHQWKGDGNGGSELVLRPANPEKGTVEGEWRGSASELEKLLKSEASKLTLDEKREIPLPNWLGQRLQACAEHLGEDVCRLEAGRTKKTWILRPREEDFSK